MVSFLVAAAFAAPVYTGMIGVYLPSQDSGSHPPMQNTKLLLPSLTLVGLLALAGCSFPGVYKIDIQQGNVVTQDMIDQLKPGMTQSQVRFIMGNPLITDTFHAKRWDYLYSTQPGGRQRYQERIALMFDSNDQLIGLAGDFMPGVSRDQEILGEDTGSAITAPQTQEVEEPAKPGSLLEQIQQEVDAAEPIAVPIPEPLDPQPQ
ncbi:outer membrane protein assembly factor BamE [Delftia sp. zbq_16]|uniref:outer membrane protein assembly factor BamE n=2 Tax=Pseudomonadota TaxID=1224 RepID=UPI003C2D0620